MRVEKEMAYLDKLVLKFAPYMVAYGVGRKMLLLRGATIDERQENAETGRIEYNKVPLLYTQKLVVVALSGLTVLPFFPYYVYDDIKRCERYVRGIPDKKAPSFHTMLVDHVFT
jgi:hypothetical protein